VPYKERRRRRRSKRRRRRRDDEEEEEGEDDGSWSVVLWRDWCPLNGRRLHKNGKSCLDK